MKAISLGAMTLSVALICSTAPLQARIVAYELQIPLDQIRPDKPFKIGDVHGGRVFFDDSEVDPKTGRVKLIGSQHHVGTKYTPTHLDPSKRSTDVWLDVKAKPWRYYSKSVEHSPSETYEVSDDPDTRRFQIRDLKDNSIIIAGTYRFVRSKLTEDEIKAIMSPGPEAGADAGKQGH